MITWRPKSPAEVVPYGIDWSATLAADEIDTSAWETISGSAVLDSESQTAQAVAVVVSGGTADETTVFQNTITTLGGFTYIEVINLSVDAAATADVPRTTRKRVLIEMCVEELKLAGYEFNFSPEEYTSTLRKLDGVCAQFPASGYNAPTTFGAGEVDDLSGLKDAEVSDFALLLAEATAPATGKTLGVTSVKRIAAAWTRLRAIYATLPTMQLAQGAPLGAGNRPWGMGRRYSTVT